METNKIKGITAIKRKGNRTSMYMKKGSSMKKEQTMKAGSKMKSSSKSGDCGCGGKTKMQEGGILPATPNKYLKFTSSRNTRNTEADLRNATLLKDSRLPATPIAPLGAGGRDPLRTMQADQYTIIDPITGKLRRRLPSERNVQYDPEMRRRNMLMNSTSAANSMPGRQISPDNSNVGRQMGPALPMVPPNNPPSKAYGAMPTGMVSSLISKSKAKRRLEAMANRDRMKEDQAAGYY